MEPTVIKIQKMNKIIKENEQDPNTKGLLLKSTWKGKIPGHSTRPIKTGVAVDIPDGYYGLILNPTNLIENYPILNRSQIIGQFNREEITLRLVNYSPYPEQVLVNQVIGILVLMPTIETELKGVAKIKKIKTEE